MFHSNLVKPKSKTVSKFKGDSIKTKCSSRKGSCIVPLYHASEHFHLCLAAISFMYMYYYSMCIDFLEFNEKN